MDKRIEIMIKHCSDNGLLHIGIGKNIIAAMQEYAEWIAKEAFIAAWAWRQEENAAVEFWFNEWLEQFKKENNGQAD